MPATAAGADVSPQRALVVDDDPTNRIFLRALLEKEGYQVIVAEHGAQAIECFRTEVPEIIFMDVMMPVMNGYEATRRIKALAGDYFIPVIFLTALTDDEALARCIEAGGDDFLTKPYKQATLQSKIAAMRRIAILQRSLRSQREELRWLNSQRNRDEEIAQSVFAGALAGNAAALARIHTHMRPVGAFSGDMLLAAHRPDGGLHLLLGDFTGHGLAAAVCALPVSELFREMTVEGREPPEILARINRRLRALLPHDRFLSACMLSAGREPGAVELWNGGMPDVLVVDGRDGRIRSRIASRNLPLGIADSSVNEYALQAVSVARRDRIIMLSDGLLEARNPGGEEYGDDRLAAAIGGGAAETAFERIRASVDAFCPPGAQDDDISLVDIPCENEVLQTGVGRVPTMRSASAPGQWRWSIELRDGVLGHTDPIPAILGQMSGFTGMASASSTVGTVISELYTNALCYGVLGLDPGLKTSEEGFDRYYALLNERLNNIRHGFIRIDLEYWRSENGERLRVVVEDSGTGFNPESYLKNEPGLMRLRGRGIRLVQMLCESVHYNTRGNRVEAIYAAGKNKCA